MTPPCPLTLPSAPRFGRGAGVWVLVLVGLLVSGCREKPPLPEARMIDVLTDLHLTRTRRTLFDSAAAPVAPDSVLQRYGIARIDFEQALAYYTADDARIVALQDSVARRIVLLADDTTQFRPAPRLQSGLPPPPPPAPSSTDSAR